MHAMHSARIPRSVGCLQASLWRSLAAVHTAPDRVRANRRRLRLAVDDYRALDRGWSCYPRVSPCGCSLITTALVRRCASSSLSRNDPFAVFSVVET
jgi:hypothetical protein